MDRNSGVKKSDDSHCKGCGAAWFEPHYDGCMIAREEHEATQPRLTPPQMSKALAAEPTPGAKKFDDGKAPIFKGVLNYFPNALEAVARVSEFGFNKYGAWGGWRHVENGYDRYTEALNRHNLAQGYDQDSKLLHIAHRAWNALATLELALTIGVDGETEPSDTK